MYYFSAAPKVIETPIFSPWIAVVAILISLGLVFLALWVRNTKWSGKRGKKRN